jgi:RNA-directed DNA polymerase
MGFAGWLGKLFAGKGRGLEELAERLGVGVDELRAVPIRYRTFTIPKRSGGARRVCAPDDQLKGVQRRILRRLLARLPCHPCAMGFERGRSIVTNARPHAGKAVTVCMDLRDFFPSTSARGVRDYFRKIGWNRAASGLLVRLCTHEGGLPQGAPTSPRLSNLANQRLDARLSGIARRYGASYTRYADDLAFSFGADEPETIRAVIRATKDVVRYEGYRLHQRRKLHIRRRWDRQVVTGLVVNEGVNLPRETRRWLRAVEHRAANGGEATLSPAQLQGWRSLQQMVATQTGRAAAPRAD